MLKKTMTYEDVDGKMVTDDFYFNLSKAELTMMAIEGQGEDLSHRLQAMIALKDGPGIVKEFVAILKMAYGKRSEDGKRFIKSPEIWEEFTQTNAYSDLVMEILTDADKSAQFMTALIPADMQEKVKNELAFPGKIEKKLEDYTQEELRAMSIEEFDRVCGTDPRKMTKDALVVAMSRRGK